LAIGPHYIDDAAERRAILDGEHGDRDRLARLQGLPAPAQVSHRVRVFGLRNPMNRLAVLFFDVEPNEAMRIGPGPLRNGPFEGDLFCHFVRHVPVVRAQRKDGRGNDDTQPKHDQALSLQGFLPLGRGKGVFTSPTRIISSPALQHNQFAAEALEVYRRGAKMRQLR